MPILRRAGSRSVTSEPSTRMRPASAISKPAITFSSVVLPDPLGPRMVTNSPAETQRPPSPSPPPSPRAEEGGHPPAPHAEPPPDPRPHGAERLARPLDVEATCLGCRTK